MANQRCLPRFIEDEFRAFLTCGAVALGCARLRCEGCGLDRWKDVRAREAEDPAFAESVEHATEEYADQLERKLVAQARQRGNPVALTVRLKALRPAAYIEKQAVLSVTADVNALDANTGRDLLAAL